MDCTTRSGRRGVLGSLDASGASMSTLCAVHCALTPALATLLPAIGLGLLADERAELALLAASATLGLASLGLGYRVHRSWRAAVVLSAGLGLLAMGRMAEGWEWGRVGMPMIVGGGLVIAASHLWNRRLCRSCRGGDGTPSARDDRPAAPFDSGRSPGRLAVDSRPEAHP